MKEKTTGKRKALYYVILAVSVLLLTAATVLTVYFTAGRDNVLENPPVDQPDDPNDPDDPDDPDKPDDPDTPSGGEDTVVFVLPVENASVSNTFGFYHNSTLGWYYEHQGVDFTAEEGTQVVSIADGTVESVSEDVLTGTQIVVDHGDGLKSVYCFVTAADGLEAGDTVLKGEAIATIAEANGSEYKDGPHLHLEVTLNGANVDPTEYLTLEEK